jgi:EmrB/QacA subfamily drug resistance transporter
MFARSEPHLGPSVIPSAPFSQLQIAGIMAGALLAILLSALDLTIVNPALTSISTDLHSLDHLAWIIVAYFITTTALTPVYGKLSDIYGRGRTMVVAIVIFVLASALCGAAQTLDQLVLFRALQGLGGGGLFVIAQSMIAEVVSPRERGKFQGFVASMWVIAGAAGPPLGGIFADHLSWRWIFWINIPLGLLALVLCRRASRYLAKPDATKTSLDVVGATLLMAAITLLLLPLSQSAVVWTPAMTLLIAGGVACLAAFVLWELRAANPILPPRLFKKRTIVWTNVVGFMMSFIQYSALVLLPVFFQLVIGMPATASGLMLVPMLVIMPLISVIVGQFMARTGRYRPIFPIAFTLMAIALLIFARLDQHASVALMEFSVILLGCGIGCCGPVLMTVTQNAADARDIGAATSSVTFARSIGASIGTAAFWAILLQPLNASAIGGARDLLQGGRAGILALPPQQRDLVVTLLVAGYHKVYLIAAAAAFATAIFAVYLKEEKLGAAPRTAAASPAEALLAESFE